MSASRRFDKVQDFADQAAAWETGGAKGIFIPRAKTNDSFVHSEEEVAFPKCDPKVQPLGSRILVQIMLPIMRSQGGLATTDETRAIDHDNMQVAKVIAVGPLAFKNRNTNELWPEGAWCAEGDYIRIPKYQKDVVSREVQVKDFTIDHVTERRVDHMASAWVRFAMVNDLDIIARYPDAETAISERPGR